MSQNRIQKLLFSEYCDFEDIVIIESPFVETTREGLGVRQVYIGLTPSKIILATDILTSAKDAPFWCVPSADPDIESFELISVFPVECVNLSVFRRRKRQALKARFCNNRVSYFELGGFERRKMLWNIWCEKVRFLSPEEHRSSLSETSVASSTSNSTVYLVSSKHVFPADGNPQLWCHFGAGDYSTDLYKQKWIDKDIYMGDRFEAITAANYKPKIEQINQMNVETIYDKNPLKWGKNYILNDSQSNELVYDNYSTKIGHIYQVNRFGNGIKEQCHTGLYLPAEDYITPRVYNEFSAQILKDFNVYTTTFDKNNNMLELADNAVLLWERNTKSLINDNFIKSQLKHQRKYGIAPNSHFFYGFGPWEVGCGDRFSVQIKRSVSSVRIEKQLIESELKLFVTKEQLVTYASIEALLNEPHYAVLKKTSKPAILFWTPDYWFRPKPAKIAYQELHIHLRKIQSSVNKVNENLKVCGKIKGKKRKMFRRRKVIESNSDSDEIDFKKGSNQVPRFMKKFKRSNKHKTNVANACTEKTSIKYLDKVLQISIPLTAWDFDSTTLANEITMVEKDLFLRIPQIEFGILIWQKSSKNAPNISAVMAFSHRISCLVATEILKDETEKLRARLVTRFISTAYKCHGMFNYQSCRSVLSGLQSPSIYRLHDTWTYVRRKHATKYQLFEQLCHEYKDPRLSLYKDACKKVKENSQYIPCIADLLTHLLDKIPDTSEQFVLDKFNTYTKENLSMKHISQQSYVSQKSTLPNILKRFTSTFHTPPNKSTEVINEVTTYDKNLMTENLFKNIAFYFEPAIYFEDNRKQRFQEVIEYLLLFQSSAANYSYHTNALVQEYILKARYREECENFCLSLKIESNKK